MLVLESAVYALSTGHDLEPVVGGWFYNSVILGCVVLAAWRGVAVREDRAAWLLIALGLGCWLAGDVWWLHSDGVAVAIPSVGDALYLAMYPPLAAALVLLTRPRIGTASGLLALDGLIRRERRAHRERGALEAEAAAEAAADDLVGAADGTEPRVAQR